MEENQRKDFLKVKKALNLLIFAFWLECIGKAVTQVWGKSGSVYYLVDSVWYYFKLKSRNAIAGIFLLVALGCILVSVVLSITAFVRLIRRQKGFGICCILYLNAHLFSSFSVIPKKMNLRVDAFAREFFTAVFFVIYAVTLWLEIKKVLPEKGKSTAANIEKKCAVILILYLVLSISDIVITKNIDRIASILTSNGTKSAWKTEQTVREICLMQSFFSDWCGLFLDIVPVCIFVFLYCVINSSEYGKTESCGDTTKKCSEGVCSGINRYWIAWGVCLAIAAEFLLPTLLLIDGFFNAIIEKRTFFYVIYIVSIVVSFTCFLIGTAKAGRMKNKYKLSAVLYVISAAYSVSLRAEAIVLDVVFADFDKELCVPLRARDIVLHLTNYEITGDWIIPVSGYLFLIVLLLCHKSEAASEEQDWDLREESRLFQVFKKRFIVFWLCCVTFCIGWILPCRMISGNIIRMSEGAYSLLGVVVFLVILIFGISIIGCAFRTLSGKKD